MTLHPVTHWALLKPDLNHNTGAELSDPHWIFISSVFILPPPELTLMSSINFFFFDNHMIAKKKMKYSSKTFNPDKVIVNPMKNSVLKL